MRYILGLGGIVLFALVTGVLCAVLGVSDELDELADARRKQREYYENSN